MYLKFNFVPSAVLVLFAEGFQTWFSALEMSCWKGFLCSSNVPSRNVPVVNPDAKRVSCGYTSKENILNQGRSRINSFSNPDAKDTAYQSEERSTLEKETALSDSQNVTLVAHRPDSLRLIHWSRFFQRVFQSGWEVPLGWGLFFRQINRYDCLPEEFSSAEVGPNSSSQDTFLEDKLHLR